MKGKKERSEEKQFEEALKEFPFLYKELRLHSKRRIIKYSKALSKYPDLKNLSIKLATIAYDFREEMLKTYAVEHTIELANARCNIQIGGFTPKLEIPEDLPAFSFERECITCQEEKKGLFMCQECWQKIRQALEIKGAKHHREGWTGWGNEWSLDLSKVIEILANKKNDKEDK